MNEETTVINKAPSHKEKIDLILSLILKSVNKDKLKKIYLYGYALDGTSRKWAKI